MKRIFYFSLMLFFAVSANAQCEVRITVDTCLYDTILVEEYYELQQSKRELDSTIIQIESMQKRLQRLALDEFLNIQDTSIFGSRFLSVDVSSVHSRNREYYELIRHIHDLNVVLNQKGEGSYSMLLRKAKENSEKATAIIDTIITTVREEVFSWLSTSQYAYYRQLIQQYNELIETMK